MLRRALPLLPPLLLAVVAGRQIYLAETTHLTPWKGGGFGMFSSTDRGDNRRLRAWVRGPERDEEVALPRRLAKRARGALLLPSPGRLDDLARQIAAAAGEEGGVITQVRIAVWRPVYDVRSLRPRLELLRELTLEVEHPPP